MGLLEICMIKCIVSIFQISGICNSSSCTLRTFDFNAFPSHVKNLQLTAYRPIIIQVML